MIILKVQGGLGNQMFQYAFARRIQEETNKKIILDISDYEYDKLRSYTLDKFRLNNNIQIDATGKYNKIYDRRVNKLIRCMYKIAPNISYEILSRIGIYIWDYVKYKPININNKKKNLFIHGYWQSTKYFNEIKKELKRELKLKSQYTNKVDDLYEKIISTNSVCVHIRRGDFLLTTNKLKVCSNQYFLNGMKEIKKKINNPIFYIFSDNIEEVKNKFSFDGFEVVFINENRTDYQELELMYTCKHFIISNSTFSWWAQYLSDSKEKIVIAPSQWYIDNRPNELVDNEWITLEP